MCDTFSFFSALNNEESFFAKNSDRDPGEPQVIEWITDARQNFRSDFLTERLPKYHRQLETLKKVFPVYGHPYAALISRPTWIWGAEMGVNEKGVSIGNEAVFSKEPLIEDGLLGMDILRLALHNAATAREAASMICELLERYGQGGNGSYSGSLKYHNSFLVKDAREVLVIESSGKNWVLKEIEGSASISNCYTIGADFSESSRDFKGIDLKKAVENRFYTFFSEGDLRSRYTAGQIASRDKGVEEVFELLRSHINPGNTLKKGMRSICVHPGTLVKSETTSSMVVHYKGDQLVVWVSSAPNPCVSVFKPVILGQKENAFPQYSSLETSLEYFNRNREVAEYLVKHQKFFNREVRTLRDALQKQLLELIYSGSATKSEAQLLADCTLCYQKEQDYLQSLEALILKLH